MAKEVNKDKKSKSEKKENKNFFKEFKAELKRVSWPTFKQLVNNTVAVLAIVILLAVIVFVLDVIFENANKFGVERLKSLVTSSSNETVDNNNEAEQTENNENQDNANTVDENENSTNTVENANTTNTTDETDSNNSVENN